jgi:hypothetical protein
MKLVVFDFAGTLSLETVLFGKDGNLERELARSGLARFGIDSAELFWNELVIPGWEEGSRTARGYEAVLAERLRVFTRSRGIPAPEESIRAAARGFAGAYFAASPISGAWRKPLNDLAAAPDTRVIIATDHYAEAGPHIQSGLSAWGITARGLLEAPPAGGEDGRLCFLIANSADLGAGKAETAFWKTVRAGLERILSRPPAKAFTSICLIDDFGFNEEARSAYGGEVKARARCASTRAAMHAALGLEPGVFPFFLENTNGEDGWTAFEILVRRAEQFIKDCR